MADIPAGGKLTNVTAATNSTDAINLNQLNSAVVSTAVYSAPMTINAVTTTSYTFVLNDAGRFVTLNNASPITATIPPNTSVAFPIGTVLTMAQLGAGQVSTTVVADTLNGTPTLKTRSQYSVTTAIKYTSTAWVLAGDLAGS